ncbi:uncharacterized protein EV422DRAFT_298851 [Fimicolochytrium jonesii]|uniref:uncharacterized protein n=1 Tax=Fimicolochytrium jonesii TaxID=1396493 RepID=UPI0022FE5427|nr:uncharacterized protein EV422DRAFT_298851 [Fimicolochytrium jonesii]KAI8816217.1 hypothetical protein EV422DRAFT_298851 [Fimicolochytrium jonesii]
MSSFPTAPPAHWSARQSLPAALHHRNRSVGNASSLVNALSVYPSPPAAEFITTQQQQQQQHSAGYSPVVGSPLSIEHNGIPGGSLSSNTSGQMQPQTTSALGAALRIQASGPPVIAEASLSSVLAELATCANAGLMSKAEYQTERAQIINGFSGRTEDRMLLLKGLKDAWDGRLISDVEFDEMSARIFRGMESSQIHTGYDSQGSLTREDPTTGGSERHSGQWMTTPSMPAAEILFGRADANVRPPLTRVARASYHGGSAHNYSTSHDTSPVYGSSHGGSPGSIPIPQRSNSESVLQQSNHSFTSQPGVPIGSYTNFESRHDGRLERHDQFGMSYETPSLVPDHYLSQSAPTHVLLEHQQAPTHPYHMQQQHHPHMHHLSPHALSQSQLPQTHMVRTSATQKRSSFSAQQPPKPRKDWRSKNPPDPILLNDQIHQMLNSVPPPAKVDGPPPPSLHRGFGASARQYNFDGSANVSEFRLKWRCRWCLCSGKYTPALRKGPLGAKTLCNACGMWYNRHGYLPKDRYREHALDEQNAAAGAASTSPPTTTMSASLSDISSSSPPAAPLTVDTSTDFKRHLHADFMMTHSPSIQRTPDTPDPSTSYSAPIQSRHFSFAHSLPHDMAIMERAMSLHDQQQAQAHSYQRPDTFSSHFPDDQTHHRLQVPKHELHREEYSTSHTTLSPQMEQFSMLSPEVASAGVSPYGNNSSPFLSEMEDWPTSPNTDAVNSPSISSFATNTTAVWTNRQMSAAPAQFYHHRQQSQHSPMMATMQMPPVTSVLPVPVPRRQGMW